MKHYTPEQRRRDSDKARERSIRYQTHTEVSAHNWGTRWTDQEDLVVLTSLKTDKEIAVELRRTYYSVVSHRFYLHKRGKEGQARKVKRTLELCDPRPIAYRGWVDNGYNGHVFRVFADREEPFLDGVNRISWGYYSAAPRRLAQELLLDVTRIHFPQLAHHECAFYAMAHCDAFTHDVIKHLPNAEPFTLQVSEICEWINIRLNKSNA